jgi:micrococcal nuclease
MTKKGLLSLCLVLMVCCNPHRVMLDRQAPATLHEEPIGHEVAVVTRVVDGDTIEVTVTRKVDGPGAGATRVGHDYDVRLLGIDTPESVDPDSPVECFGPEASAAAKAFLLGMTVRLVKDVEEVDQYGRLLRYVYVGEEMADARLVINGYAFAYPYPPNDRHASLLDALMHRARALDRGLWADDACAGRGPPAA